VKFLVPATLLGVSVGSVWVVSDTNHPVEAFLVLVPLICLGLFFMWLDRDN
jgi:hypothetical protein